jgi:hypothetical protein
MWQYSAQHSRVRPEISRRDGSIARGLAGCCCTHSITGTIPPSIPLKVLRPTRLRQSQPKSPSRCVTSGTCVKFGACIQRRCSPTGPVPLGIEARRSRIGKIQERPAFKIRPKYGRSAQLDKYFNMLGQINHLLSFSLAEVNSLLYGIRKFDRRKSVKFDPSARIFESAVTFSQSREPGSEPRVRRFRWR